MPQSVRRFALLILFLGLLVAAPRGASALDPGTALQAYVEKPDTSYGWVKRRDGEIGGVKYAELILTSQTWRDIVWKHQVFIMVPEKVDTPEHGLLLISGGAWKPELEEPVKGDEKLPQELVVMATACKRSGAPVILLNQVPQQPIFDGKTEDAIISYTFEEYLKSGDLEWPLLLPMVKSAVKAMDCAQEFGKKELNLDLKNFTVTGASKRGWTTWLTGAADKRATAIAPMVIDVLNMQAQMKHQLETWGAYSVQIQDYTDRGIQSAAGSEAGTRLNKIVDPYNYRDKLTQPKLLIMGTNDPYWTLDACNIYWNDLEGEKYLLYVPNNGHGLNDFGRLLGSISAWHKKNAGTLEFPKLTWDIAESAENLTLDLKSDQAPKKVVAWVATAPTRDFRESKWTSVPMVEKDGGWQFVLPTPAEGYAATFGEAVYDAGGTPFYLSTNVRIIKAPNAPIAEVPTESAKGN